MCNFLKYLFCIVRGDLWKSWQKKVCNYMAVCIKFLQKVLPLINRLVIAQQNYWIMDLWKDNLLLIVI